MSAAAMAFQSGSVRASARQLGSRLNALAAGYLETTPLAQWHRQKLQIDEASIIARAKALGLRLVRATAVNAEAYDIYDNRGRFLRRGSLSSMQHFAERYRNINRTDNQVFPYELPAPRTLHPLQRRIDQPA